MFFIKVKDLKCKHSKINKTGLFAQIVPLRPCREEFYRSLWGSVRKSNVHIHWQVAPSNVIQACGWCPLKLGSLQTINILKHVYSNNYSALCMRAKVNQ